MVLVLYATIYSILHHCAHYCMSLYFSLLHIANSALYSILHTIVWHMALYNFTPDYSTVHCEIHSTLRAPMLSYPIFFTLYTLQNLLLPYHQCTKNRVPPGITIFPFPRKQITFTLGQCLET